MILFYSTIITGESITLNESESAHCVKTLRHKAGDIIFITDTKGSLFKAEITIADQKATTANIIENISTDSTKFKLHIAVAPTKNPDRIEWFLEKATEAGIFEFTPILCRHSEKKHINCQRLERIVTAAAKQSLKTFFPIVHPEKKFDEIITDCTYNYKFIATCSDQIPTQNLKTVYQSDSDAIILIGPEGDFSIDEISKATNEGFVPINLGKNRYRTETAALIACFTIQFINESL
jgi:16S rRNA (uracil1498-N3)-methyltransferase